MSYRRLYIAHHVSGPPVLPRRSSRLTVTHFWIGAMEWREDV